MRLTPIDYPSRVVRSIYTTLNAYEIESAKDLIYLFSSYSFHALHRHRSSPRPQVEWPRVWPANHCSSTTPWSSRRDREWPAVGNVTGSDKYD